MDQLAAALHQLIGPIWDLVNSLLALLLPWTPLAAWVVFWLFAVNWVKLRESLHRGAWIGLALIGFVMILVWGAVAPPQAGTQNLLGLHVSNFVEKTVYVSGLFCIMFIAGSLQLSGFCGDWCQFEEPILIAEGHGHEHGGHEHGDHGTGDHGAGGDHGHAAADSHGAHGHH